MQGTLAQTISRRRRCFFGYARPKITVHTEHTVRKVPRVALSSRSFSTFVCWGLKNRNRTSCYATPNFNVALRIVIVRHVSLRQHLTQQSVALRITTARYVTLRQLLSQQV